MKGNEPLTDEFLRLERVKTIAHESAHTLAHMALYENVERIWIDYSVPTSWVRTRGQQRVTNRCYGADLEAVALVAGIVGELHGLGADPIAHWKAGGPTYDDYARYQEIAGLCKLSLTEHMTIAKSLLEDFREIWDWIQAISGEPDHEKLLMEARIEHGGQFFDFRQRHFSQLEPIFPTSE